MVCEPAIRVIAALDNVETDGLPREAMAPKFAASARLIVGKRPVSAPLPTYDSVLKLAGMPSVVMSKPSLGVKKFSCSRLKPVRASSSSVGVIVSL